MAQSRKRRGKRGKDYSNRLYVVAAIIFLLSGMVVFQLVKLQVWQHDLYTALASDQHLAYNKLMPERGKIFVVDREGDKNSLFPEATNKDFAMLYAIPMKINDPELAAEKLFEILDKETVATSVDKILRTDEFFAPLNDPDALSAAEWKERKEFFEIKKEAEIEIRKKAIVDEYLKKLSLKNDPYEPIRDKIDEETLAKILALNIEGFDYIMAKHRYYPDNEIGAQLLGFVGYDGDDKKGRYGLEGFFDEELAGLQGTLKSERSANGELIIINDREYKKETDGSDLVLTIDRSIQYEACTRLDEAVMRHGADGGSIVVMEPFTGAIIAMCSWPGFDPNNYGEVEDINQYNNPVIFEDYEPGSIFKVITMAAALDQGAVSPQTTYVDNGFVNIEGWPKPIKNSDFETHGGYGRVDMVTVLNDSLNTGAIFAMEKIGAETFAEYVKSFGFGEKTGIELETEGVTNIVSLNRNRIRPVEAATASFGQGITATPLQLVTAYSAIANGGILMKPYVVAEIIPPSGIAEKTQPHQIRRAISEKTSLLLSGMMVNVIEGGHAKLAAVNGYFVAGKTGTAQVADRERGGYLENYTIHTFVGFAPVETPKFVMLIKLDHPKDVPFAASSAAPLFGKIADFILNYYQVPKER